MKGTCYMMIAALFLLGCQDVIDLETPTGEVRLNIDAHFRVYTAEQPPRTEGEVMITETTNFFSEEIPVVSGAVVRIVERGTGAVHLLEEDPQGSGVYSVGNLDFLNNFEETFDLQVMVGDQLYTAHARTVPTAPILNIEQGDLEVFGEEDLEIIVTISDNPDNGDYYLFDYGFNLYQPLNDTFFNGNEFEFSFLYTEDDEVNLMPGDVITVTNDGIDEQFFDYMELLLDQTEGGAIFSSPPATVRGNIVNETEPENFAFGYFRVSEAMDMEYTVLED